MEDLHQLAQQDVLLQFLEFAEDFLDDLYLIK